MSTAVVTKLPAVTSARHGDAKVGAYPEYKSSEVDWVGELPAHWDVKRFKYLFRIKKEIAGKLGFDVLSITQRGIRVKDVESGEGQVASDYSKYQIVKAGDFAMNHMDLLTGFVDLSRQDGVTSPDYRVFALEDRASSKPYYLFLLQLCYAAKIFYPLGQGAAHVGRWRLPAEAFTDFRAPRPPLAEQVAIAKYLDRETARIDNLIAEKQNFINLLKEKRQALISHVVTKGLDPKAKMKDSGIEWIGEVPEHWAIKKIAYVCRMRSGDAITSESIKDDEEYPVYGGNGLRGYFDQYNHDGDYILIGRQGALCGNINYGSGRFWASEHAVVVYQNRSTSLFWLGETLRAMNLNQYSTSAAQPGLSVSNIISLKLPYPTLEEQKAIENVIRSETSKIDQIYQEVERSIELLREHRTALISAAVTGKIDVRDH